MKVCAEFCEDHSRAVETLRTKQRGNKDRLTQILQVTLSLLARTVGIAATRVDFEVTP